MTMFHKHQSEILLRLVLVEHCHHIELETFEAGFDIFSQYDDNVPQAPIGEGSRENPYVVPTRNQGRVVFLDSSCEAPGVEGIGAPLKPFWVWQDGDGHSG